MNLLDCNDTGNGSGLGVEGEEVDEYMSMVAAEVKHYIMGLGMPVISGLGLLGNFLALVVLTKEKLHKTLSKMEISAHIGLIALAVSDLLFCFSVLCVTVLPLKGVYEAGEVLVYYHLISGGLITVFIITSTWLIVVMAAERYVAVCHPLKARNLISLTRTRAYVIILFVVCPLCTIPVFLERRIEECWAGRVMFRVVETAPENVAVRRIVWALSFDFVPCFALIYFNTCLIWKIRRAKQLRDRMAPHQSGNSCMHHNSNNVRRFRWDRSNTNSPDHGLRKNDSNKTLVGSARNSRLINDLDSSSHDHSHSGANSVELHPREMQLCKQNGTTLVRTSQRALLANNNQRRSPSARCGQMRQSRSSNGRRRFSDNALNSVTATLVAVVLTFLILVSPWELLKFGLQSSTSPMDRYKVDIALYATNFLQVLNFSFNFVLYCVVNKSFRHTLSNILCCRTCNNS